MYEKEAHDQAERVKQFKAENKDEHDIKRQVCDLWRKLLMSRKTFCASASKWFQTRSAAAQRQLQT